jgi:putative DNA primase/helicase
MAEAPSYTTNDTTHTFTWNDGSRLEVQAPHRDRGGRLLADVAAYTDPNHILNHTTLSLLDDGACQRFVERCAALDGQVNWTARLVFAVHYIHEHLQHAEQARSPEPLRRAITPPEPYPMAALGAVLAPMARKLWEVIQAPDAICGQGVLAAAAVAVQGAADVLIDGRQFPVSEAFISIAESGERKTATDNAALWPHYHHERTLAKRYHTALQDYANRFEAYRKAREEALKSAKGRAAKEATLKALGPPPYAPCEPFLLVQEPTYEGLIKLLVKGLPSMGLFTDEGGRFLRGHAMNDDNLLKTAAGLSELWDGKRITRVRATDESIMLYGRWLSLHLMVQPVVAQGVLSNPLLLGQGFLSRCLVCWPESTAGTRPYKAVDLTQDRDVKRYNARLLDILETLLPGDMPDDIPHECEPRLLPLSTQAKKLWIVFHNHIESQLGDGGPLAPVRSFGNKAAEHAARLAAVLTLVDRLDAAAIDAQHMRAGITLLEFYLAEALRLCDAAGADPDLVLAETTLAWVQQYDVVHLAQIYQYGPNSVRDAKTARRMLAILEEHGWVTRIEGGQEIDGAHRREVWRVRQ